MDQDNLFADEQITPQQQRTLKEMGRMSQDRIRIYNPSDQDYNVRFDSLYFFVPGKLNDIGYGKGIAIHPRYVAAKFAREMTEKILGEKVINATRAENQRREQGGLARLTKYDGENSEFGFGKQVTEGVDDERVRILTQIWVRVESKYGMDTPQAQADEQRRDPRDIYTDILEKLENTQRTSSVDETKGVSTTIADPAPITPEQSPQVNQAKEAMFETLEQ